MQPTGRPDVKEETAKEPATEKAGRDDVHEQRERGQPREGVVHERGAKPPDAPPTPDETASEKGEPKPGAPSIPHTTPRR